MGLNSKNPLLKFALLHGLEPRKRQVAIPNGLLNLALHVRVNSGILINFNFDSTVLSSTFSGRVRCDRFGFAESLTRDPAALHTLFHYVIPHRHPTPI